MQASREPGRAFVLAIYATLVVVAYVSVGTVTAIFSMLSAFYREFGDPARIGWVVSSYFLVSAVSAAVCGRFGDLIGRRRIALIVLGVTAVGASLSASAANLAWIIAGCAVQGIAGSLPPLILGMIREVLPARKVPFAVGVVMATLVAGGGVSFLAAGLIIDQYGWAGGFMLSALTAVAGFLLLWAVIPGHPGSGENLGSVKILPGILFAPAIAGFFVANEWARDAGWSSPPVISVLLGSVVVLVLWARHQLHQEHPLIDVRSLGHRQVLLANICMGFLALGCMQNGQLLPLFMQQPTWTGTGFGFSAAASGAIMLPLLSVALIASPMSGGIAARQGARQAALYGFLLGAVGWFINTAYHASFSLFVAASLLGSLCVCLGQPAIYNLIIEATPEEHTSEATGLTNVFVSVFLAVGSQFLSLLLSTARIGDASRGLYPTDHAYTLAFAFIGIMSVIGVLATLMLPRKAAIPVSQVETPVARRANG